VNTIIAIIVFIFTPDSVCCFEVLLSLTIQQLVLNKNLYRAMPLRTGVFLWVEIKLAFGASPSITQYIARSIYGY
jgi:hypothetical protein